MLPVAIVPNGEQTVQFGRVIEVQPGDVTARTVLQRAPDSAGSPDVANAVLIADLPPGAYVLTDVLTNDGQTYYWRAKHTKSGYQDSSWTSWTPGLVPRKMFGEGFDPRVQIVFREGRRLVDSVVDTDGDLKDTTTLGSRRIFRHGEEGIAQAAGGDAAVTFAQSYANAPVVTVLPHQVIGFNSSLGTASDQYLRLQALNISPSGFTARAQNVSKGTITNQSDDFPAGNNLTANGQTTVATLDPAGANDDTYMVHYKVTLSVTVEPGGVGKASLTVVVAIDSNDGAGWVERATQSYACQQVGPGTANCSWSHEDTSITVTGLGLNDQIRLRVKSVTFTDQTGLGSYTLSVHGFNVPTDADPDNGVTYTTATDTVESAMPDAEDGARWIARDVT